MDNKKEYTGEKFSFEKASEIYHNLLNEENNKDYDALLTEIASGDNYIRQTNRVEVKAFDSSFINELEEGLDAVSKILANPRTFIKEEAELVEAGRAKKITSLSVRHFASHSQFLRDIDEDGNVTPDKILTIHAETDTAIYENRFVMTLIKKTLSFIQTRYWWVVEHGETFDSDLLLIHNKTEIDGVTYEVDSRMKISVPSKDNGNSERNNDLLTRLTNLRAKCSYFLRSPFMEEMKGAKDVASPIHMTNMLQKHPEYRRAYNLWVFLDKYEELGISYDITDVDQKFNDAYKKELNKFVANSILTIHSNRVNTNELPVARKIKYEPKVIFDLEDVTYADGRFLFDAYPEAKVDHSIPLPPLPEEVREENERFKQHLENQKSAKVNVDRAILADKDKVCYDEAKKRVEKQRILNAERKALILEAETLRKENEDLKKQIEELKSRKK